MTETDALALWRELLHVTRLIFAVHAVTKTDTSEAVWQAGLTALEQRRQVLACVLSLEDPALLKRVYAQLVDEVQPRNDRQMSITTRVH